MAMVNIACTIVGGLILNGFVDQNNNPIKLNGPVTAGSTGLNLGRRNLGAGITAIDSGVWTAWSAANASNPLIINGAVFQAS
jgi:hypothetical protein